MSPKQVINVVGFRNYFISAFTIMSAYVLNRIVLIFDESKVSLSMDNAWKSIDISILKRGEIKNQTTFTSFQLWLKRRVSRVSRFSTQLNL